MLPNNPRLPQTLARTTKTPRTAGTRKGAVMVLASPCPSVPVRVVLSRQGLSDRPALHDTIEECGKGVERGQGDVLAPRLEAAGERAGDAAAAAGAGNGERDLGAVEAGDDAVRDLDGAARAPHLAERAAHHRPIADQVGLLAVDVQRLDAAFIGDVEMVRDRKSTR